MRKTRYIYALIVILLVACDKDFEEINTNPNAPVDAQPSLLLRQVIYNTGEEMSYEGFVAGNLLSQHFAMVDFNLFDRHNLNQPQLGGNPWPVLYTNLRDNELLLQKARSSSVFSVYEGPALILKAYLSAMLTDIYGDVPYFQAFKGNTTPAYDSQEAIYTAAGGILDNLRQGVAKLENINTQSSLEGDIIFNGDVNSWIKFGNSLLIKHLMRISDRQSVAQELEQIFSSGDYLSSNAENATFDFAAGPPNNFRMANLRSGDFNLYVMSETSEEILEKYGDNRIGVFFRNRSADTSGTEPYRGLINGIDASQTSITLADYSLAGTIFRENTAKLDANFITAWETHFLLAEAAERGLISGSAQSLYELAVQQAFDYWGTEMPASYLSTDSAAYKINGADPIQQIIEQKWIANTINAYEGWIEYRRTGYPKLKSVAASLNNDLIPVRIAYPSDEQALNSANYSVAAANTNGNSINSKTWWDNN